MSVLTDDDLAALFNVNEFGASAVHTNANNVETTLKGIFDNTYFSADLATGSVNISESNPTFIGRTSDFSDLAYGDTLEIDSVTWIIREIMPDGTGVTELSLERQ